MFHARPLGRSLTIILLLATDPVDTKRVYIATGMYTNSWDPNNGQIMRSTDYGQTWATTVLSFKVGGNMPGRGMGEVSYPYGDGMLSFTSGYDDL
jgi:hypothetical protein